MWKIYYRQSGVFMDLKKLFLTVFVFGTMCSILTAKEPVMRIAVINMNRVFENYQKTRINESKLKKQSEIFQKYASELSASIQKLHKEFLRLRSSSQNLAYTGAERENMRLNAKEKYMQFQAKKRELERYEQEKRAQLRDQYEKHRNEILKDITAVVNNKSIAEGYTLVLDRSGRSLNNIPVVIYASNAVDITNSVIKTLNVGYSADGGKAPGKKGKN